MKKQKEIKFKVNFPKDIPKRIRKLNENNFKLLSLLKRKAKKTSKKFLELKFKNEKTKIKVYGFLKNFRKANNFNKNIFIRNKSLFLEKNLVLEKKK